MELKFKYRMAQLNATQREKENTTGSVNKRSASSVTSDDTNTGAKAAYEKADSKRSKSS